MSGSYKKPTVPSRPPPPKVSSGSKISFSFKALEEEDDEELTLVTGKFDKQVMETKEKQAQSNALAFERNRAGSKSPESQREELGEKSPGFRTQNSFDKLLDLKDKLQDTIVKKKGELVESFSTSPKAKSFLEGSPKSKEFFPQTAKEKEFTNSTTSVRTESSNYDADEEDERFLSLGDSGKEEGLVDSVSMDANYFDVVEDESPSGMMDDDNDEDNLEMSEEYFKDDGVQDSESSEIPLLRQRKKFQKFRKIKPIIPASPVSMSTLNSKPIDKTSETSGDNSSPTQNSNTSASKPERDQNGNQNNTMSVINIYGAQIPIKKHHPYILLAFVIYVFLPLPSYISGLIMGAVLASGGWLIYLWIMAPPKPREAIPLEPSLDELPPMIVPPQLKEPKTTEDGIYKVRTIVKGKHLIC